MDIGEQERVIIVEPTHLPAPAEEPARREPLVEPREEPASEPEPADERATNERR